MMEERLERIEEKLDIILNALLNYETEFPKRYRVDLHTHDMHYFNSTIDDLHNINGLLVSECDECYDYDSEDEVDMYSTIVTVYNAKAFDELDKLGIEYSEV